MKNNKYIIQGFTLIEVLVSITILSIILISVFSIYISSTDINLKTDITRALQQNVKSSIELIWEDIRKNWFDCVNNTYWDLCTLPWVNITETWDRLVIWNNIYFLAQKWFTNYENVDVTQCDEIDEKCTLVMKNGSFPAKPIMNSWVDVKDVNFLVSDTWIKKVTIVMKLQPAIWKWIKPNLIKNNTFYFQTTISERNTINLN